MQTVTIDIIDSNAMQLLQDLEKMHLIKIKGSGQELQEPAVDYVKKYKGAIKKQPLDELDAQLDELRNSWE